MVESQGLEYSHLSLDHASDPDKKWFIVDHFVDEENEYGVEGFTSMDRVMRLGDA